MIYGATMTRKRRQAGFELLWPADPSERVNMAVGRAALKSMIATMFINFVVFSGIAFYYGGVPKTPLFDPMPAQGPYFLDEHGHLTEVDSRIYSWLVWQSRSIFLTLPLGGLSLWLLRRRKKCSGSAPPTV
jgi:hypothetical protein